MKTYSYFPRIAAVALFGALAWAAFPNTGSASPPDFTAVGSAPPSFIHHSGTAAFASRTSNSNLQLPTSVMPNNQAQCSVESTDPGNPPRCSATVAGGVTQRCSAHADSRQQCSAYLSAAGGTKAHCSTLGGDGPVCSVLQPPMGSIAPSQCSAFGSSTGKQILCSVMDAGGKQFCSVENPGTQAQNQCSTFQSAGAAGGGTHFCSALNGGGARKNFCSARGAAPPGSSTMFCSTHTANSQCSIRIGQKGSCTSLMNAPQGSCSAFAAGSHCSVIGGAPGTTTCP